MVLSFKSRELRAICEKKEKAIDEYGEECAQKLRDRIADLRAESNVKDFIFGNPIKSDDGPKDKYQVKIDDTHYLIFCSGHSKTPLDENGEIDWSKVKRIKILKIIGK